MIVLLPEPVVPRSATVCPGSTVKLTPAEDLALAARVAEARRRGTRPGPRARGSVSAPGAIRDLDRGVEQLEDAHRRGARPRDLRGEEADRHDRHQQEREVGVEGDRARRAVSRPWKISQPPTRPPRACRGSRRRYTNGKLRRRSRDQLEVLLEQRVGSTARSAASSRCLAGERAHHPQPAQLLLERWCSAARASPGSRSNSGRILPTNRRNTNRIGTVGRSRRAPVSGVEREAADHRAADEHHRRGDELDDAACRRRCAPARRRWSSRVSSWPVCAWS